MVWYGLSTEPPYFVVGGMLTKGGVNTVSCLSCVFLFSDTSLACLFVCLSSRGGGINGWVLAVLVERPLLFRGLFKGKQPLQEGSKSLERSV